MYIKWMEEKYNKQNFWRDLIVRILTARTNTDGSGGRVAIEGNRVANHEIDRRFSRAIQLGFSFDIESKLCKELESLVVIDLHADRLVALISLINDMLQKRTSETFALLVRQDTNVSNGDEMWIRGHDLAAHLVTGRLDLENSTQGRCPSDEACEFLGIENIRPRASLRLSSPDQDSFATVHLHSKVSALQRC